MKKKSRPSIKGFVNKKENLAMITIAVILCAGVAVTNLKPDSIPLHDGDVLVDSQNVAQAGEPGDNTAAEGESTAEGDGSESSDSASDSAAKSFEEKRAKLELQRNDLIAGYNDTIKNSASKAEKNNALKQKEKLSSYMEQEVAIEGIIRTKNLPESMVIITDSTVNITVDEQDLKQNTVAKICNIVMGETKRTADKIIIQSHY